MLWAVSFILESEIFTKKVPQTRPFFVIAGVSEGMGRKCMEESGYVRRSTGGRGWFPYLSYLLVSLPLGYGRR